ncbi:alpha/beta hydrolase [Rhizobium sp. VS19-DR104.2]|uniref:alpha/beta hydrolase n=1 Tax=unclassified Rhizobium TaxID=2613769 RepID=UPI001CC5A40B|nr:MULTISPECIES: alpha/beta hydrolase [unclassified Rhizobium]MBZ5762754.1 alpha/beta hydrolase [Rhizobium sp. VS19-DR96]MBZ5768677.1 alpha/beta hydrolase [Rhizobium sp. VS19-DR129.2]MBZ5776206.1 alpha/beta hydrolase [Rhizobium sp. VS19-DRK62.2]MBZ5787048.1 alpha/beta hydrolase [Rhizobium sp. VS19-DR121]MBZ5804769.1 alpha/beta hydrolase [Rhizobium sp. VS19-DR181]
MTRRIDAGAQRVLDLGRAARSRPFEDGTPEQARKDYNAGAPALKGDLQPVASIENRTITGPNGPIDIRIYRGLGAPESGGRGLLYLHGGGWVIGNLESHDDICRWFADSAACTVVCPDYRLAPEHKFPAGLEDCLAALAFMTGEADTLGIDREKIAVAGDSAGGNLTAVVALMSRVSDRPPLTAQLLLYPNTDAAQTADSYRRYAKGFGLSASTMHWFRDHYIRTPDDIDDWRVSPLRAESLSGAAPAFIAIAGHDILADEGVAYADRLKEDAVPVVLRHWPTQIHGFASMGKYIPEARAAIDEAVIAWNSFETSTP